MLIMARFISLASIPLLTTAILMQDVTQAGFETLLKDNDLLLAAFSSRTYEFVQPFHKLFEESAASVKTPYVIIDCDEEQELCARYDVNAYPAVRLFKRKDDEEEVEVTRYRGKRTKSAIKSFVTKHEVPTITHIQPEYLPSFKKIDEIVVVAYLRPDQETLLEEFRSVALSLHQNHVFGYVNDMPTADTEGLAMPSVVCYKNTDGDNKVLNGHFATADVEKFLETATKTIIGDFNERNMDAYMAPGKLAAYIFASTEDEATALRHQLTPTAKKYEKYVTFGVADAVEYAPMAKNFGLAGEQFPALAVHAPMNDNVFTYQQGRKIMPSVVDAMLTTILQAKATSGQMFGTEAPDMDDVEAQKGEKGHDEL